MAIRKMGSRRIVIDGTAYRWRIRPRATYPQIAYESRTLTVAIALDGQMGSILVIETDRPHPRYCIPRASSPVTPVDVSHWIKQAIEAGWMPSHPGPQMHVRLVTAPGHASLIIAAGQQDAL